MNAALATMSRRLIVRRYGGIGDPSSSHSSSEIGYRPATRSVMWSPSPLAGLLRRGRSEPDQPARRACRQRRAESAARVDVAVRNGLTRGILVAVRHAGVVGGQLEPGLRSA